LSANGTGNQSSRSNGSSLREVGLELEDANMKIKLKYVLIASNLPSFGGRSFLVTYKPTLLDMAMEVRRTRN